MMMMMKIVIISLILLFSPMIHGDDDDDDDDPSINLLVRSSVNSTNRRYCVQLAKLPNGHTVNVTGFNWHSPYIASPSVNACNITDIRQSLPSSFPSNTLLVVSEHDCKMTVHAWNIESLYGHNISLMILTNRTNVNYELIYNTTTMPVSIPVLIFGQKDYNQMKSIYGNLSNVEISITYAPVLPRKFRPAVLLMFLLVLGILLAGNFWAADEFIRKIKKRSSSTRTESVSSHDSSSTNQRELSTNQRDLSTIDNINASRPVTTTTTTAAAAVAATTTARASEHTPTNKPAPSNSEPAILSMPYCIIALILCFAIGWILLIYYFPTVMIYILQALFCIGAFSSLTSCLDRLSYFLPILRRFHLPSCTCRKPCKCQLGPWNVFTLFAMAISLTLIAVWYVYRQAVWAWVLQDILGAAVCITIISVYRLGNMRVITLILLGFFLYDIFFVFITPYIPFFQPSKPATSSTTTTTTIRPFFDSSDTHVVVLRKVSRTPSVMEQVALGFGTNGEVVPLLFALPMFIPESENDPCVGMRKSMLGFGDVILPGILLTFCKIFDIAAENRWPIYYTQSVFAYFLGLTLTHVALYVMNTAQPALLYLVPCILLSTMITGLCRGEFKELFTGRRIQALLTDAKDPRTALLANSDSSIGEQGNQSHDVVVGISDTVGAVTGVENR